MRQATRSQARTAFTLVELLVVLAIMGVLFSVLLPAMSACRRAARNLKCISQFRSVSFEFRAFADDFHLREGEDSAAFGPQSFELSNFQEQLYRVGPYWDLPDTKWAAYDATREPLMCPEGPRRLERRAEVQFAGGSVFPQHNVSVAFNMRLHRATEVMAGRPVLVPQLVTSRILEYPDVPLVIDVDGAAAAAAFQLPYYTAPPTGQSDNFKSGRYWFPAYRHGGSLNIGLVGGSVQSSRRADDEAGLRWTYQPQ